MTFLWQNPLFALRSDFTKGDRVIFHSPEGDDIPMAIVDVSRAGIHLATDEDSEFSLFVPNRAIPKMISRMPNPE